MTAPAPVLHPPIRLILADNTIFRQGFQLLLKKQTGIKLVGQVGDGKELLELVEKEKPDVVITDVEMPGIDGIAATQAIKENFANVRIIALSMYADDYTVLKMLEAGASGYLLKSTSKEELILAVHKVAKNEMYYCSTVANKLVRLMARNKLDPYKEAQTSKFSEKEMRIIRLVCQGYSSKEIAVEMGLTLRAVESARERIQAKTGARNAVGIVVYAIKHGICSVD